MACQSDAVTLPEILRDTVAGLTLGALLTGAVLFLALHAAQILGTLRRSELGVVLARFSLETEGGPGEVWETAKTATCVVALAGAARCSRQPVHLAVAVAFGIVLLDNLFGLHEWVGAALADRLSDALGVSRETTEALAEGAAFAAEGLLIASVLAIGFLGSARCHWPLAAVPVLLLLVLAMFSVGVDLIHALLRPRLWAAQVFLGTLEDWGEMLVLSPAAAFAVGLRRRLAATGRRDGAPGG